MKIALLCSGLGPGKNGVGDYARRLAGELIRGGHAAILVALNDPAVDVATCETQDGSGVLVEALRLPAAQSWEIRCEVAHDWLKGFGPDWISLQFVCFGFHPKGLIHAVTPRLERLCVDYNVHCMFHELWVGLEQGHPWTFKPWGWLQRAIILRLHRRLRIKVTHTSNQTYARELARNGITAAVLPLPGSFPPTDETEWMGTIGEASGIPAGERDLWTVLGIFGTIQRQWLSRPWIEHVLNQARGHKIALLGVGRLQGPSAVIWQETVERYGTRVRMHHFGEQPATHISQFLRYIDMGIATGLASLVGKSSAVATMLEHRKAVLVPFWDLPAEAASIHPETELSMRLGLRAIEPKDKQDAGNSAGQLAERLIAALEEVA